MSQKRAKIHHFVPKVLQKYFQSEDGGIWFSEKNNDGKFNRPELRNITSTFKSRDYYTVYEGGELSDRIERDFYGTIDNRLGDILHEIHSTLDKGLVPTVHGKSLESLQNIVYHLLVRTPEFTSKNDDYLVGFQLINTVLEEAKSRGLPSEEIEKLNLRLANRAHVRNSGRDIRVKVQALPSEEIMKLLRAYKVRFVISEGRHSFVLSSAAVYRLGNGGSNGLENLKSEFWLPISPKRVLVLVRDVDEKIPLLSSENRDHAREVNEYSVSTSSQIASHSEDLLKSLIL